MLMEREPAFLRDKGNISMLVPNFHRKLYQLGKNLATWKMMEIIPFVSCEPHLTLHDFYKRLVGIKNRKNPNKYNSLLFQKCYWMLDTA